jgi:DNA-binding CsgD family transcriptional regulator
MLLLKRLLQLKEQGSSNRRIAVILHLTRNTVNAYQRYKI